MKTLKKTDEKELEKNEKEIIGDKNEFKDDRKVFTEDENENIESIENQKNSINTKKRVKRTKLSSADAKKIWNAYTVKGPAFAFEFALSFGYRKSTYYKVIDCQGQINVKWNHPCHSKKWTNEQINTVISWIEDNPVLTLDEMISKGLENGYPLIQPSTLSNYLNGRLITLKKVRLNPVARKSTETKKQRIEYCSKFLDNSTKTFIFIDEM